MAAWDGQGRPEWGHGVNRRERRTDGTRIVYIYMFLGAFVSFFFFFCRGGVSSLFRDVFSLLFWVPRSSRGSLSSPKARRRSKALLFPTMMISTVVFFLSLTTLLQTPGSFLSSFSSERGSAAGEDRHARGHHRPQNGTGEDF